MIEFNDIMKHKTDYCTIEEVIAMLNYCNDRAEGHAENKFLKNQWLRNYALLLTLFNTGRRISEIVGQPPFVTVPGLRPMDFRENCLIEFNILKKNQVRTKGRYGNKLAEDVILKRRLTKAHMRWIMPVTQDYYDFMKDYIQFVGAPSHIRLFRITRQRVDLIIKEVAQACQIFRDNRKIHAHQFRHTFAIHFLKGNNRNPMALVQLKDLLKHSKIDITTTYTQFTHEDKKESMEHAFGKNFGLNADDD